MDKALLLQAQIHILRGNVHLPRPLLYCHDGKMDLVITCLFHILPVAGRPFREPAEFLFPTQI